MKNKLSRKSMLEGNEAMVYLVETPIRKRHIAPIIGAVTYLGAIAHDIAGTIENPFKDTFRDRTGNINIHGDRDNNVNIDANCNGTCNGNVQGNVHVQGQGNVDVQGQGNIKATSNINLSANTKVNGQGALNLNLHFGFRRTNNARRGSNTIFVPIDEMSGIENLNSFGYSIKRYAVYCVRNKIYE